MKLIPGRTDSNAGPGSSVLWQSMVSKDCGIFNKWWYSPEVKSKKAQPEAEGSERLSKTIEKSTVVNMVHVLLIEILEMAPR